MYFQHITIDGIKPGSGPLGVVAHASWLGQPSQESDVPAVSDWGPGQSIYQQNQTKNNKQLG